MPTADPARLAEVEYVMVEQWVRIKMQQCVCPGCKNLFKPRPRKLYCRDKCNHKAFKMRKGLLRTPVST